MSQAELSNKANKLLCMKEGLEENDRTWLRRMEHYRDEDYYGAVRRSKKQEEIVRKIVNKYKVLLPT